MRQQEVEGGDDDKEEEEMDGVEQHLKKQITRIQGKGLHGFMEKDYTDLNRLHGFFLVHKSRTCGTN